MKLKSTLLALTACILLTGSLIAQTTAYYQLKIYTLINDSQEQRMDAFLKHAYLPAMHHAGISRLGVFKPIAADTLAGKRIYVLIPLNSLDQFEKLPALLADDKKFQADGNDYIDASHDNAPYQRIETILLKTFSGMPDVGVPEHSTPPSERVYELRSYQGATEKYFEKKMEMFNDGGEITLFKDLGFNPVFFGEVVSGKTMPNLMYLTSFSNETSRKEHWSTFQNSPGWKGIKDLEKYKNTVSKIEISLLYPADYSDL